MMNLRVVGTSKTTQKLLAALGALTAFGLVPSDGLAASDRDDDSMSILPAPPAWVEGLDLSGRYVAVRGSESKFREDHNIQSGATLGAGAYDEFGKGNIVFFDGLAQPVEEQGYGRFGFEKLGVFSFDASVQAWTEFYNTRPGVEDVTVLGTRLDGSGVFPNTTNSRALFGGGKPSVDWLTVKAGGDLELPGPFNDLYGSVMYRRVGGEMSLAKGGTIRDPRASANGVIGGSGPGSVFFDFPGRKDVDYETIGGNAGLRSTLGGLTWRLDASAFRHQLEATTREANFDLTPGASELESFREETEIVTARTNLVVSRQVTPSLFVYGGGAFSISQSDPEPSQSVQTGFFATSTGAILSRRTISADVERLSEAANVGMILQPHRTVVLSADVGVRANQQEGDLSEIRNESTFATGDTGSVTNNSERDHVSVNAKGDIRWKATRRLSLKSFASYKYSQDEVNSSRIFGFVVAEAPEIEDYDLTRETIKVGASGRYRFRAGRKLELGYEFMYDGSETDVNRLVNQFLVADYQRLQHKGFAKASGKIVGKLRGDLRVQYIYEERDMDAPLVNAVINPTSDNGELEFHSLTITPTLTYQHSPEFSGFVTISVGRQRWELANPGVKPAGFGSRFASFEYDTVTESATLGVNWSPAERLSGSATYSVYTNHDSVKNTGYDAHIRGAYELDENWDLHSGLRYLRFNPENNTIDDYATLIFTVGLSGSF